MQILFLFFLKSLSHYRIQMFLLSNDDFIGVDEGDWIAVTVLLEEVTSKVIITLLVHVYE